MLSFKSWKTLSYHSIVFVWSLSCLTLGDLMDCSPPDSSVHGIVHGIVACPRQQQWGEFPFPPPGGLPDLGTEPASLALAGRIFTTGPPGKVRRWYFLPKEGSFISTEILRFSAATFMDYLSWVSWVTCCRFYISNCCFTLNFYIIEMASFLQPDDPITFASYFFFCSFLTYLSPHRIEGFPDGASGKEHTCQRRRHKRQEFDPWLGKISWRRA